MITDLTNPIEQLQGFLHEAKATDMAYNIAIGDNTMPQSITHAATNPTTADSTCFTTLQAHERIADATHTTIMQAQEAPKIFCDASVDSQNPTTTNQTGIGVCILTQPARSTSHVSFFRQRFHMSWSHWRLKLRPSFLVKS
jgi:hypothetical protein